MINNNIQEAYCSFEVSKLLKEKGFDVSTETLYWLEDELNPELVYSRTPRQGFHKEYGGSLLAPTHSVAIEWIRVNFGIWVSVEIASCNTFRPKAYELDGDKFGGWEGYKYSSPQEATEAALLYTLKNLIL